MKYLELINLDDRNFVNNLFKDLDLSDKYDELEENFYFQFTKKENQKIRIYEIGELKYILHLTSTKEKKWRVTTLIKDMPTSHIILNDYLEGIKYLIEQIGYKNLFKKIDNTKEIKIELF